MLKDDSQTPTQPWNLSPANARTHAAVNLDRCTRLPPIQLQTTQNWDVPYLRTSSPPIGPASRYLLIRIRSDFEYDRLDLTRCCFDGRRSNRIKFLDFVAKLFPGDGEIPEGLRAFPTLRHLPAYSRERAKVVVCGTPFLHVVAFECQYTLSWRYATINFER